MLRLQPSSAPSSTLTFFTGTNCVFKRLLAGEQGSWPACSLVTSVAWSPDGKYIASASYDRTVQIWDAASGNLVYTYHGHKDKVYAVAWSPDNRTVASAADNVQLWNGFNGEHIFTYTKHAISVSLEVQAVAWSPNGKYIVSGGMEGTV